MDFETPWQTLDYALQTDHAELAVRSMISLVRLGETAEDLERWTERWVVAHYG